MSETPSVAAPENELTTAFDSIEGGKRTDIADYCAYRMEQGAIECVFLCVKDGRRYYAKDLQLDMERPSLGLDKLRKHPLFGGWWKRYSLYSTVGVKEVLVGGATHRDCPG